MLGDCGKRAIFAPQFIHCAGGLVTEDMAYALTQVSFFLFIGDLLRLVAHIHI